jgi:ABC-type nitrate/sulfonate/bicarbonate transport system substrate-binding protein
LTYRALVRKLGLDSAKITEVAVKYDMTPLFTGQVDVWPGYAINEPIVAQEKGHEVTLIWPPDYGITLYADTLFTTEAMLARRPEVVRSLVRATLKGWQDALDHPDEAVEFTLKYGKNLDREHERSMLDASIPLVKPDDRPIGTMDQARWQQMHDLLLEQGFLRRPITIDQAFTTRFVEGR